VTLKTNASHNRDQAFRMLKAGMSTRDIAEYFPAVFYIDDQELLAQRYDRELDDGRKETAYMIISSKVDELIAKHRSENTLNEETA
jgi:hypothetical protein